MTRRGFMASLAALAASAVVPFRRKRIEPPVVWVETVHKPLVGIWEFHCMSTQFVNGKVIVKQWTVCEADRQAPPQAMQVWATC